jgi:hypothetical protein
MPFDTTTAPSAQEAPRAHPSLFDKQIWLDAIMRRTDLTASAKVLAWRLADHHNQNTGRCNPPLPTLAKGTGTSRSVVHENLNALRDAGLIDWTSGNSSRSNSYVLMGVAIHERTAKPASPAPQRGKAPHLRLVPKDDAPASETVRPTGLRPSGPPDRQPSGQSDTNSPILTPEGTLPPLSPSEREVAIEAFKAGIDDFDFDTLAKIEAGTFVFPFDRPAPPLSPLAGLRVEQDTTDTHKPVVKVERQRQATETQWPDDLVWSNQIRDMASKRAARGSDFIKEAFLDFKAHALKNSRRSKDWHKAWLDWYDEASLRAARSQKGAAV